MDDPQNTPRTKPEEEKEDTEEEAISLSDFPIDANNESHENKDFSNFQDRRSSSEPSDFFEFFNDLSAEMSHAEDIIFCGKLVPYFKEQQQPVPNEWRQKWQPRNKDENMRFEHRRRCESMSELKTSRSNSTKINLMQNSRSLDYRKLQRNSSLVTKSGTSSEIHRSSSKSSVKSEGLKASKPRWYVIMFGLAKFPPEMDLQDIKSRQVRRNPSSMFPAGEIGRSNTPVNRRSSWGHDLLKVLSCKSDASVSVTASMAFMPPQA